MKKICKIIVLIIVTFFSMFFISNNKVNAESSINKVSMDVYINKNGTAQVTEIWEAYLDQGTEGYRTYGNLGNCSITNFIVYDDLGNKYTTLNSWDSRKTFEDKSYKCGIKHISSNTVELCWGISNYGKRTYTLKYNITNFIEQYKDSQGIYFSFIPKEMNQSINSATITIYSDIKFTEDNCRIWAFGYPNGDINFANGKIIMNSRGNLPSSNYMTALVQINNGTFNTEEIKNVTFSDIYQEAMKDVNVKKYNRYLIPFLFPIVLTVLMLILMRKRNRVFSSKTKITLHDEVFDYGEGGNELPSMHEINYFRDIPCNNDLYFAYWIICKYNILKRNEAREGIIGAIILKWIKEGEIEVVKSNNIFSMGKYAIDLKELITGNDEIEDKLVKILRYASGKNGILEQSEFKKWSKRNYNEINTWFNSIIEYETLLLEKEGLITETTEKKEEKDFINIIKTKHISTSIKEEAINLLGLKKFLLNYSYISEREAIEVNLWEDYLIFAQLLGIANKVEKQFKKLYPDFNQISKLNTNYATNCTRIMAYTVVHTAIKEFNRQERIENRSSSSDYSSGSGGSSHSNGGSSASGSSSGGGFR